MGSFVHACEGDMVCKSINEKIPYFNAPIYLENKTQIGRVDEILGPINQVVRDGAPAVAARPTLPFPPLIPNRCMYSTFQSRSWRASWRPPSSPRTRCTLARTSCCLWSASCPSPRAPRRPGPRVPVDEAAAVVPEVEALHGADGAALGAEAASVAVAGPLPVGGEALGAVAVVAAVPIVGDTRQRGRH